jgi:hypothetical protein
MAPYALATPVASTSPTVLWQGEGHSFALGFTPGAVAIVSQVPGIQRFALRRLQGARTQSLARD